MTYVMGAVASATDRYKDLKPEKKLNEGNTLCSSGKEEQRRIRAWAKGNGNIVWNMRQWRMDDNIHVPTDVTHVLFTQSERRPSVSVLL